MSDSGSEKSPGLPVPRVDVASAHLLPLLIPHAVVNRDVTRHVGAQRWIHAVGPAPESDHEGSLYRHLAARGISVLPWLEGYKGLGPAWLAAAKPSFTLGSRALRPSAVIECLLEYFDAHERSYSAALADLEAAIAATPVIDDLDDTADNDDATLYLCGLFDVAPVPPAPQSLLPFPLGADVPTAERLSALAPSPIARAAAAWLRGCPHRRPIDLPRAAAEQAHLDGEMPDGQLSESCRLLSHCVTELSIDGRKSVLEVLLALSLVTRVVTSRRYANTVRGAVRSARLDVAAPIIGRVTSTGGMLDDVFPNAHSLRMDDEAREISTWEDVKDRPNLRHLEVDDTDFGNLFGDTESESDDDDDSAALTAAVCSAITVVGRGLLTLAIETTKASLLGPPLLQCISETCFRLRELDLDLPAPVPGDVFVWLARLHNLRVLKVAGLKLTRPLKDDEESHAALCALPAALPALERLTQSTWRDVLTADFVDAVGRGRSLAEWSTDSLVFAPEGRSPPAGPLFPKLRKATVPLGYAALAAAKGPCLRLFAESANGHTFGARVDARRVFQGVRFASPYVRYSGPRPGFPRSATHLLAAHQHTGVWAMTTSFHPHDADPDPQPLPRSVRHLTVVCPGDYLPEWEQLIGAAKAPEGGSLLESLVLSKPPDVDPVAALCDGGFPRLKALRVFGAPDAWIAAAPALVRTFGPSVAVTRVNPSPIDLASITAPPRGPYQKVDGLDVGA